MNLIQSIRRRIADIARKEAQREIEMVYERLPQLIAFHQSPPHERQDFYDHTQDPLRFHELFARLRDELQSLGAAVEDKPVDLQDFQLWLSGHAQLSEFYKMMGASRIQKCLEHYMVDRLLRLQPDQVYVDIGAKNSPWARLLRRRSVRAYRLDLSYPLGRHGIDIGADACATGLPDAFADALSLQCAFNCFAGDADIRFLPEAARLLKPRGRCAIAPLCVDETHYCTRSPYCDLSGMEPDPGAKWVWRTDGFRLPFVRAYSPEAFRDRILKNLPAALSAAIFYVTNLRELARAFPGQRIYGYFCLLLTKQAP
jgi:SAM-dependent methyltransferase